MTKKEIEAAIKPEFMAKLKKLRVKTKFMNNIMDSQWEFSYAIPNKTEINLNNCITANNWDTFIGNAFNWESSPEGSDFWADIYYK